MGNTNIIQRVQLSEQEVDQAANMLADTRSEVDFEDFLNQFDAAQNTFKIYTYIFESLNSLIKQNNMRDLAALFNSFRIDTRSQI